MIKAAVGRPLLGSSSEDRCRKAFDAWATPYLPEKRPLLRLIAWNSWKACWTYLQERARTEFIEQ